MKFFPSKGHENFDIAPAHPGIGPIGLNNYKELKYHNYYMWIPYLLLFQSVTFFIPLLLHRFCQEGKVQILLSGIHNIISFKGESYECFDDKRTLVKYQSQSEVIKVVL